MKNIKRSSQQLIMKVDELSRSLLENAPCPITAINPDTSLKYANPAFEKLTGFSLPEIIGRQAPYPWWPEETWAKRLPSLKKLMAGTNKTIEQIIQNKNGERFLVQLNVVRVVEKGTFKYHLAYWHDITERKRAEEVLIESEEKYRTLVEDALIGIMNVDLTGKITYVNNTILHDTGYSREELIGKNAFRLGLVTSEMIKVLRNRMKEKLTGQPPGLLQLQFKCKDGRWIWLQIRGKVIRKHNIPVGIQVIGEEITERKRTEEALRESEEFSTSLLENAPHSIIVINPDTSVRYINPAFEKLNGWTLDEVVGIKVPYPWWPDEDREVLTAGFLEAMKHRVGKAEGIVQKKNKERYWIELSWAPVMRDGELQYLLINSIDITERKQAEEALRESEEKLRLMFQASADGIAFTDMNGIIIDCNQSAVNMYGASSREEILGKSCLEFIDQLDKERVAADLQRITAGELLQNTEYIMQRIDGSRYYAEVSPRVIKDTSGNPFGIIAIIRDITKRKQVEERVRHLNLTLHSIRDINQLITREKDRSKLLRNVCKNLVDTQSCFYAWVALFDQSSKLLEYAESNIGKDFLPILKKLQAGVLPVCAQDALRQSEVVVIKDIHTTCRECPLARKTNSQGRLSVRLEHEGKNYGILCAAVPLHVTSDNDELTLFQEVADDIAFALHDMELEEESKKAEEKNRVIIERALDGFCIVNLEGKFLEANESYCRMVGYTREELLSMFLCDIEAIEKPDEISRHIQKVIKKGSDLFETRHRRKDGTVIDIEASANYLDLDEGQIFVFFRDITERKQAEEALRESEEKFSRAFRSSPDRIAITTLDDGRFVDVNDSYILYTGYSREEVIGHTTRELGSWPNPHDREKIVKKLKEQGGVSNEEVHLRIKSGEIRTSLFSAEQIEINREPCMISVATDITERKQAEEALRESEEKFSRAFRSSPDMVAITTLDDGRFVDVNDSYVHFAGYTREEVIGHTSKEFDTWPNPHDRERIVKKLKEQGRVYNEEVDLRTKSGKIRTSLFSAEPIEINGKPCMISIATDITERKQAEEALRESEEKFSKAFRSSPDIICITTLKDGRYIEVNDSFTRVSGYSREEVIGRTSDEFNTWVPAEERDRMIRMLLENGRIRNEEFNTRSKSGKIQTMLMSAEVIEIGGEPCIIGVLTDITERKKAEKALRESEEKFSKAFRSSPDIISITTLKDGRYIEVNDSFTRIAGYSREEVIGRTTTELNTWAQAGERDRMIRILLEKGRVRNEEFITRSKSGKIHTMSISAEIIDIGGEPCIISVSTDITERKQAEERQREADNLKELDRLRTELLANISHELRTPLSSIKGFATVLLEYEHKLKRHEKREYLETIDQNTDRLVELIEQLLDMSRLGAGMLSIEKAPTGISKLFQEVLAGVQVRAPGHRFTLDLPAKLPRARIDSKRIRQVLDNLTDNAVKHSRAGTEITIRARKKGDEILVAVSDQGTGIPKNILPRVFERFFSSGKRHVAGTSGAGLGLSICKGLVEAHGGRIWIESEVGRGTTCFFTLPVYQRPGNDHGKKG
jgi:PAS domain S-box-containing protein